MAEGLKKVTLNGCLDSFNDALVACDTKGKIFIFNKVAAKFTNISSEQAIGQSIDEIIPQLELWDVLEKGENKVLRTIKINNKKLESSCFPLYDGEGGLLGAIGTFEVPGVKLNSTFKLTDEIEKILESSYDGIWITDGKGYVLYTNSANERLSGFKREEVLGQHTQELLDKKLFSQSVTLEVINMKKRVTMMGYNYNAKKQVLITGNPIFDDQGNITYVVNNIRDITELITLKEKLGMKDKLIDQQKNELAHLRSQQIYSSYDIVVNSVKMRYAVDLAQRVGKFDSTVLILGESGTGKEMMAQTVVRASDRSEEAFIKVNCGAIPDNLLESELFGYEKGAFTGADKKGKIGMFEMAQNGTIFLDEVAELPLNLQVKLLRVLQEKEVVRIGGTKPTKLDIRIIAATNQDVEEMVKEGVFREDLFYRLNVVTITVPPLRERPDDVPALITHFLHKFNEKYKLNKIVSPQVVDILTDYWWPGNVRELENLIENVVVLTQSEVIEPEHLPAKFRWEIDTLKPQVEVKGIPPLKEAVRLLERDLIEKAMKKFGTTRKAAEILGVDQSTIVRKIQKLNKEVQEK